MTNSIVFIDSEVSVSDKKIQDLGAVWHSGAQFHGASIREFSTFIEGADFICGHNVVHHDLTYILPKLNRPLRAAPIDTLYLSPLLFPQRPYHALLKDDKLHSDELNNPLSDAEKARRLFYDEVNAFFALPPKIKQIYYGLLNQAEEFQGFFRFLGYKPFAARLPKTIRREFDGRLCANADIDAFVRDHPVELAYALALIHADDRYSITPPWLLHHYPALPFVMKALRGTPCREGCAYCHTALSIYPKLKEFFGFDQFRTFGGDPLQEQAVQAAVDGKSLLAVFPTGGGKSLTFQLPALMAGQAERGLTVVISPLQSLMKDQVDNLSERGLVDAVTVNGLLSPIERAEALDRVASGLATLFYISPEQLRSRTIEKLLLSRTVSRVVIDEAHCFSAWGHDFRVEYFYIGDFIRRLQELKGLDAPIPVSCFTATAKQKVISDIRDYFRNKLGLELELFTSSAERENLRYQVIHQETDEDKYSTMRAILERTDGPAIVYVSRRERAEKLSRRLNSDGFSARPFHGGMEASDKTANQDAFIRNEVRIIVATSAFGMGVDKKDVRLVIHHDISDSLENYVQEAGRAGRDPSMRAECYVLYHDNDLDKHFMLLNQTKLSIGEIQQVWRAIKDLTRQRPTVCCSPLEIARQAGWDDSRRAEMETRVKTAVAALENAGYVSRGRNVPRVYATSILARNMAEASARIDGSPLFPDKSRQNAKRIISSLISSRSIAGAGNDDAESRVDYLADTLGLERRDVVDCVNLMRQDGLLADSRDMSAYLYKNDTQNRSAQTLERFARLERFILEKLEELGSGFALKQLNEMALDAGISHSSVKNIRTILYYLTIKEDISKREFEGSQHTAVTLSMELPRLLKKYEKRIDICRFIVESLYAQAAGQGAWEQRDEVMVQFSLVGLYQDYCAQPRIDVAPSDVSLTDLEDALLYLSKIGAMKLEGGFLVLYNGMEVKRLVLDNKIRYKVDDYKSLNEFYKQRIQQIHIVGEYANLMVRDYEAALRFVQDYFQMDFRKFISKYFKGERAKEIDRNITPGEYHRLFGGLSEIQSRIIQDANSKYIVAAAGPGSGKTRVLVHKLASLMQLEDVKHEQLLMVTFSRAAATEFKKRLISLIRNAANFAEIKTFHSYCFDLLGKIGSLEGVENVVRDAAALIERGEVEPGRVAKTVLVIDEAQDMDENEFALVRALMGRNEELRVIAVGDDDQNIYEFRGSDSKYMRALVEDFGAARYEMTENYRSCRTIVALANAFARTMENRMKTAGIEAVRQEDGVVQIVRHTGVHLEQPVVEHLLATYHGGTACVLTNTNEEALRVLGLLIRHGVRARLIQSADGFSLYNLAEIRFFLKAIDGELHSPVISDSLWEKAKKRLESGYGTSSSMELCRNLIADFEQISGYAKYRSDLEGFIRESKPEDFYTDELGTVFVSTIHRSKGREFDSVYMLLDRVPVDNDADRRKLYVGITRAKNALYIHCNTDIFLPLRVPGADYSEDPTQYPAPGEIILQLTHKDVVLDFFKDKKRQITSLRGGMPLALDGPYLVTGPEGRGFRAAKLSKACLERLALLRRKGYVPDSALVRFIVAWKGQDEEKETAVLLADIHLSKLAG